MCLVLLLGRGWSGQEGEDEGEVEVEDGQGSMRASPVAVDIRLAWSWKELQQRWIDSAAILAATWTIHATLPRVKNGGSTSEVEVKYIRNR